jgi:hypothetical protein
MSKKEAATRHAMRKALKLLCTLHEIEKADLPSAFSRNIRLNLRKQIKQALREALKGE